MEPRPSARCNGQREAAVSRPCLPLAVTVTACSSVPSSTRPSQPSSTARATAPRSPAVNAAPSFIGLADCPITDPQPGVTPPPPVDASGAPPVPYVKYWYGNDVLW